MDFQDQVQNTGIQDQDQHQPIQQQNHQRCLNLIHLHPFISPRTYHTAIPISRFSTLTIKRSPSASLQASKPDIYMCSIQDQSRSTLLTSLASNPHMLSAMPPLPLSTHPSMFLSIYPTNQPTSQFQHSIRDLDLQKRGNMHRTFYVLSISSIHLF